MESLFPGNTLPPSLFTPSSRTLKKPCSLHAMAIKNLSFLFSLTTFLSLFSLSSPSHHTQHHQPPPSPPILPTTLPPPHLAFATNSFPFTSPLDQDNNGGKWTLLQESIGVSAMHMQLLYNNKVIIFDRTDFGPSNLPLLSGHCRYNDETLPVDCTAHSLLYDVNSNTFRPLMVQTDVWCSSGSLNPAGTLVQTGGYHSGDRKIRLFTPCNDDNCDWFETTQNLSVQRWYSSNHILPDGRVIIVGGRKSFSYEFFPKNSALLNGSFGNNKTMELFNLPFLIETNDPKEENNLYPFLHLLPDGNLYIFANQRSILFDYMNNKVVKEFPAIPGEKRSYPATGSSVLLPLRLAGDGSQSPSPEVMICGGANAGAFSKALKGVYVAASKTCGRLRLTDSVPQWVMEEMPISRVMPDMILLPTGHLMIINGASRGTAGWENAVDPVLNPVLYQPEETDPEQRFNVLNPTTIPRMYHSSACLLPDGRILVGGSNPHVQYNFTGVKYPTELSLEAFSPPYLEPEYSFLRPSILSVEGSTDDCLFYGQKFSITFALGFDGPARGFTVTMTAPSFNTHSFGMNQRLLVLDIVEVERLSAFGYKVSMYAPPTRSIAPPGYYMLFLVHDGVPGHSVWVKMK